MARQTGSFRITGTIDGLCFYRMEGQHYVRRSSCINRQRYLSDPAFERRRASAAAMKLASPLASSLYRQLPPERRKGKAFQQLAGMVKKQISHGRSMAEIECWFREVYVDAPRTATGPCLRHRDKTVPPVGRLALPVYPPFTRTLPCLTPLRRSRKKKRVLVPLCAANPPRAS